MLSGFLLLVALGSLVYCALAVLAARSYRAQKPPQPEPDGPVAPISVLKPLAGLEDDLDAHLASFFEQDHPEFEILLAVRQAEDPAAAIARNLQARYPRIPSRLIVTGEPACPNPKVYSLARMAAAARHGLLVMTDSDVWAGPRMLREIAAEFADPRVGLVSCPYRAVPTESFWSQLEALTINTEALGGALVARMIEGMKFALGPAIAIRRETLASIGGFDGLKDFLAEDFVMGNRAAAKGWQVLFSSCVIDHHIGGRGFGPVWGHMLRWYRSTRRSRPWGYVGQAFLNPLPPALLLGLLGSSAWWGALAGAAVVFRAAAAWATAVWALQDPLSRRRWYLIPLADGLSLSLWIAGFFGRHITWRGRRYKLLRGGRFELG
ncbi:MAG: glycosyltransferase [Acidobacteria bacterium]|nr:glycosyltransferase [Acidobacteriota bacterium]